MGALAKNRQASQHEEGVGAVSIDGKIVLFDGNDYVLDGRVWAVVIRSDGSLGIEKPLAYGPGLYGRSVRQSAYGVGSLGDGRFRAVHSCTVLGRVIDGAGRAKPKERIDHLASQISLAIDEEFGGEYTVTIQAGGKIDYRWGAPEAA